VRIDVHAHYYDDAILSGAAALGCDFRAVATGAPSAGLDLAQRLRLMDQAGIQRQVLSPGGLQPYVADAGRAVAAARLINNAYSRLVADHGGRLGAFGCVPLPHVEAAIAEAGRCLDELGFSGINLGCSVGDHPLDDASFEPLWAELDRRNAVVFLHPMGIERPMMDAFALTWAIGGRFEDTVAAARLVHSGVTTRHARLRIIVPHLGGVIPYLWDRFRDRRTASGEIYDAAAGLKRLYYDSNNLASGMLCAACHLVGASQVMLGTDFPWTPADLTRNVRSVEESGLPPAEVEAILDSNAAALLNL
jgi:predicted TIM-barrel fold metal-dependent hydrolase